MITIIHPNLQPPNAGYFNRYKWCFKKLIPSYAVWPCYRGNDQRPNSVCSADIKGKNNLPPQMKYLLESHVCAFKWLAPESSNWMSRNIEGTGVVLIVFQSNWSTIFWRVHSIRFPTTNEILPHNDWFTPALVSKPAGGKKKNAWHVWQQRPVWYSVLYFYIYALMTASRTLHPGFIQFLHENCESLQQLCASKCTEGSFLLASVRDVPI